MTASTAPFRAFGGAVWLDDGPHYMNDTDLAKNSEVITKPQETAMVEKISSSTPSCESLESGFCQRSPKDYVYKILESPAVPYQPRTPDRKEVIGVCTLCNDSTFSPSCAVGRGACSHHGGVSAYGVERYRIIPGTPAVQAKDAVYSYATKTYQDSDLYEKPAEPSLKAVVGL